MPPDDLVDAYIEGRVSRRTLIRRLVASGVSAGAAVSYAHLLSPDSAGASVRQRLVGDDHYPLVQLKITSSDPHDVVHDAQLRVLIRSSEPVQALGLNAFLKQPKGLALLGYRNGLSCGSRRTVAVPVNTQLLQGKSQASIYVYMSNARDSDEGFPAWAAAHRTLRH